MEDRVKKFREVAEQICNLYEKKDKCYGGSFNTTYDNLGIISAATRISDKYNRLCNLVKNPNIDNLGESLCDTLMDFAAYSIMTIVKLNENEQQNQKED